MFKLLIILAIIFGGYYWYINGGKQYLERAEQNPTAEIKTDMNRYNEMNESLNKNIDNDSSAAAKIIRNIANENAN